MRSRRVRSRNRRGGLIPALCSLRRRAVSAPTQPCECGGTHPGRTDPDGRRGPTLRPPRRAVDGDFDVLARHRSTRTHHRGAHVSTTHTPTVTIAPTTTTTHATAPVSAARTVVARKVYRTGEAAVTALDDVTVQLNQGEFTAIMGPSGSGKSTLLHLLAGLDRPDPGEVYLADTEITLLKDKALTLLRRDRIGFIFQSFNLLPTLTAAENIVLPMRIAGRRPDDHWIASIVDTVGLTGRLSHRPAQLSGDSSSVSPPSGPWRRDRRSCSPMSRPVLWTRPLAPSCSPFSAPPSPISARPLSWSPTTPWRPVTPTASSSSPTVTSSTSSARPPPSRCSTT